MECMNGMKARKNECWNEWLNQWMNQWKNEGQNESMNDRLRSIYNYIIISKFIYYLFIGWFMCSLFGRMEDAIAIVHSPVLRCLLGKQWEQQWLTDWLAEWTEWMNECMHECMHEWMNECMHACMNACMHAPFVDLIFQECSGTLSFFKRFFLVTNYSVMMMMMVVMMIMTVFQVVYVKSISCHCLVHILSTSSSKSAPCTSVLNMFKWKSSYRYSPVHFLLTTFPDRPAKPRKQRPSFGDHGSHFTRKKHRVSRPNVFKPEFTCSRPLTLPNYLTTTWWWCGWHADGEKASHYNRL